MGEFPLIAGAALRPKGQVLLRGKGDRVGGQGYLEKKYFHPLTVNPPDAVAEQESSRLRNMENPATHTRPGADPVVASAARLAKEMIGEKIK